MKRWLITVGIVVVMILLSVSTRWWLTPLLAFVGANTDTIQGLADLAQIALWIGAGIFFVVRLWRKPTPDPRSTAPQPITRSKIKGQDHAVVASHEGVAGGLIAIGENVNGDVNIVLDAKQLDPKQFEQIFGSKRPKPDLTAAVNAYLDTLVNRYRYLDFRGMGISDRVSLRLPLVEMYVPLKARIDLPDGEETWKRLRLAGRKMSEEEAEIVGQRASEPQPVIDMLRKHNGLIILGDPGAGKTTFLKYLTLLLATGQGEAAGLAVKLPILVPLSAYANRLADGDIALDTFIGDYHRDRGIDQVPPMLAEALAQGGALLLLDGLDEVKNLGQRKLVVDRVADFFTVQQRRGNKFILTSRIVGYREVRPAVEGLIECTLVDFQDDEIALFVDKWTQAIERAATGEGAKSAEDARREKSDLMEALRRNPGVRDLAANPLLLTILALMKRQGVTLPERRVELYQKYVETLLRHWNLVRGLGRPPSRELDLVETLRVLAPLALWMHETSPGVGLVPQEEARRRLEAIYTERGIDEPAQAAVRFLADVHDHAGLLLERGHRQYGFIHLTFQEYLAGVALAQQAQQKIDPLVHALAAHLGDDNWHEASLLAVGHVGIIQQRDQAAGDALLDLMRRNPGQPGRAVIFAGEAVLDAWPGGVTPACRIEVRQALLAALRDQTVPTVNRAEAGRVLAKLGDPRSEVLDPLKMAWCAIPAGPFLMGEGRERYEYTLPYAFNIARYPVTVAQYEVFAKAGGYAEGRYWAEAQKAGYWQDGLFRDWFDDKRRPHQRLYDEPFNLDNHPVVGVSWYEALAFTRWLTAQMQAAGTLPPDRRVHLPNEPEWERAARSTDGRSTPWGGKPDPERSNGEESQIRTTSAVGCFPGGASPAPEGVEDLLGNVWEWTRSNHDDLPYPSEQRERERRENLEGNGKVIRGDSWASRNISASFRVGADPNDRHNIIGFRVVVVPISHGS